MKKHFFPLFLLLVLSNCSSGPKSNDKAIKKVITITEYLVLNENFFQLDSVHQQKTIEKLDADNKSLEELDFWGPKSQAGGGLIYKYNKKGEKIEEYLLNTQGEIAAKFIYEYTPTQFDKIEIMEEGRKVKRETNYYDKARNISRQVTYDNDGNPMYECYFKYNAANQPIEKGGILAGKKIQTTYKIYDSLSNLMEQKLVDTNGITVSLEQFTYEAVDATGNWKIRKCMSQNKPHSVAFQNIEMR